MQLVSIRLDTKRETDGATHDMVPAGDLSDLFIPGFRSGDPQHSNLVPRCQTTKAENIIWQFGFEQAHSLLLRLVHGHNDKGDHNAEGPRLNALTVSTGNPSPCSRENHAHWCNRYKHGVFFVQQSQGGALGLVSLRLHVSGQQEYCVTLRRSLKHQHILRKWPHQRDLDATKARSCVFPLRSHLSSSHSGHYGSVQWAGCCFALPSEAPAIPLYTLYCEPASAETQSLGFL